jgi:hypothetical protein
MISNSRPINMPALANSVSQLLASGEIFISQTQIDNREEIALRMGLISKQMQYPFRINSGNYNPFLATVVSRAEKAIGIVNGTFQSPG